MASHSPSDASALNPHGDSFHIANLQEEVKLLLKQVCNYSATCSCGVLVKFQKEREDDRVINFLRGLNEEFAQVRLIMMLVPLPSIAKSFALILQQEREFGNPSSSHFAQVRSQIMMLVSFPSIVKSFAPIL
jgi:CRISPR/Cas system Type II protein with McrA/HNH and RuvC-like nuclease domain